MKALLLCGYRVGENQEDPPGLERDEAGIIQIDRRIQELQRLGLDVVCVVSGPTSEKQLRHSLRIADVELAFDDETNACLISNVRAGLTAVKNNEGCFVQPVEVPCPPAELWSLLKEYWRQTRFDSTYAVLQAAETNGHLCHFGFPLVISRRGHQILRENPEIHSLVNTRLEFLHLAPDGNPI
jgi:hypothetical protein